MRSLFRILEITRYPHPPAATNPILLHFPRDMLRTLHQFVHNRSHATSPLWLLIVPLLLLGISGLAPHTTLETVSFDQIESGCPYAVRTIADRCSLDIDFQDHKSYMLIISSLGNPHQEHLVELSSRPIPQRKSCPLSYISQGHMPFNQAIGMSTPGFPPSPSPGKPVKKSPQTNAQQRNYSLHVTEGPLHDAKQYTRIQTTCIASSPAVHVYLDNQLNHLQIAPGVAQFIINELQQNTIPHLETQLGRVQDVDGDGRLTVVLTPWLEQLQGGKTSLGGMVRAADFDVTIPCPFSNHGDILYLNANVKPGEHLQTLLMHELTHAVSISARRQFSSQYLSTEEDWLNEALAHVMEIQAAEHWSNLDYRISRYLNHTERYPLVIPNYYEAGLWRNHGCRGATFLFLQWCVDRFGEQTLQKLVNSHRTGTENIATATHTPFATLFRLWTISQLPPQFRQPTNEDQAEPTVDLYQRLGHWNLTGPNIQHWQPGENLRSFNLQGTAASYVHIDTPGINEPQRITIHGSPGSELQVTLIPCSSYCPQLEISQAEHLSDETNNRLKLSLSVTGSEAWSISTISCECNQGEIKKSYCINPADIITCQTKAHIGETAESSKRSCREFELTLPDWMTENPADWTVKVIARTEKGTLLSARSSFNAVKR